jgi:hypothetical protein
MRDRRLIVPAVALLVAILAVPVVLSSDPDPVAPAAPLPPDPAAAAVEPGVLAVQEVGVRDYRERLDSLGRKNPFGDQFEEKAAGGAAEASALAAPDEATVPVDSAPAAPGSDTPGVTSPSGNSGPTPPPPPDDEEIEYVLVPRIDVEVGVVDRDRRKTIEGVKSGDLLPSKEAPVAMFLGNSDDSSVAELLVSRDVSNVNGEGRCKPGKNNCEFLRLGDGDVAYLRYADGKRYKVLVKNIYFVRVPASKVKKGE